MPNAEKLYRNLVEIKSQTDALLAYSNSQTGKEDQGLGEAIRTLVDKIGSSGASNVACGEYTFESVSVPASGRTIELPFDGTPSMVFMYVDRETFDGIPEDDKVNNRLYFIGVFSDGLDFPPYYYNASNPKTKLKAIASTSTNTSTEGKALTGINNNIINPTYAQHWGVGDGYITVGRYSTASISFLPVTYKWIAIYTDTPSTPTEPDADWELVASTTASLNLSRDTSFDSITPSTNNQVVKTATYSHMDIVLDEPIDTTEYDVIIVTKVAYEIVYKSNMLPRQKSGKGICFAEIHSTESFKYIFPNMTTMYNVKTFDGKGNLFTTNETTFGVNKTASVPTIKTNDSPTNIGATNTHTKKYLTEVIFNSGQVTVRCNTSSTVESVSDIDSSATTFFDEALIYKKPKTSKDFIASLLDEIDS